MSFYLILIEKLAHDDKQAKNQTSTLHPAQSNIIKMAFVRHTAPFFGHLFSTILLWHQQSAATESWKCK